MLNILDQFWNRETGDLRQSSILQLTGKKHYMHQERLKKYKKRSKKRNHDGHEGTCKTVYSFQRLVLRRSFKSKPCMKERTCIKREP